MIIQLFSSFEKKTNSTKRPTGTVDKSVTGTLKEPCSITNPVFKIERLSPDSSPDVYTYAIIPSFHRFYFVEDWTWVDGLWECRMIVDVLATYKNAIGAETEYILRTDSTSSFNGDICDTAYPATTDYTTRETYASNVFPTDISIGCYIVGIISGTNTQAVGAITYYAMTSSELGALKDMLMSDDNMDIMKIIDTSTTPPTPLVQDISYEVLKTLYNPFQYIVSCIWFPFSKTSIGSYTQVSAIKIGWWGYPLSGGRLYAQTIEFGESVALSSHPQASTRGNYLNFAPYTRRTLIGRFGTVPIDNAYFKTGDSISIGYLVDLITGQCRTTIEDRYYINTTLHIDKIAERYFLLGVPIQLSQIGVDYLGTAVSALNSVGGTFNSATSGFVSGGVVGAVTGAITGVANGIYNTLQSSMPQVETSGSNGSFLAPATRTALLENFATIVDEDIHHKGRPLCALRQINTLSGYILCAEGDMDINCFDKERRMITNFLTTGFFYE